MRSELLDAVRRFIRRERMLDPGEPLHVAVSGGIDSMVLLHVLGALGHPCSVLHVDHGLRGAESDGDRAFVEDHCRRAGIAFRWKRVDAAAHARAHALSIQMAARALRQAFFAEAHRDRPWKVALAHHADDAVETLLMHLMRGAGIEGWSGIRPVQGIHVRPLLAVPREAIEAYAAQHRIAHREDSSNSSSKYLRNRVRHELLPLMEALRPGARRAMARSIHQLRGLVLAAEQAIDDGRAQGPSEAGWRIPFAAIEHSVAPALSLSRRFRRLGFHPDAIERLHDAIVERSTGTEFMAGGWRVVVDRDSLIVSPCPSRPSAFIIDGRHAEGRRAGFQWSLQEGPAPAAHRTKDAALLDAQRLAFPLEVRPWRAGDRMRPIGLGGSKLVSDILIDAKVPLHEKERTHVLVSATGEIAWLAGHRIGEGFQATAGTVRWLLVEQGR